MNQDLIRHIDGICRDKNIDRDAFIADLENAMVSAIRKAYEVEEAEVQLDPLSGTIRANAAGDPIDMQTLGRIAAQTAKQVIIQKTRERERTSIQEEFTERRGTIVTGTVVRIEKGNLLVNIGRTEGFLPRSEQIPGETPMIGSRLRVLILEVREQGSQIRIILSRSHPEFIVRLFELEVPEVSERIIEIKALAREAGYRTKVAVSSIDSKVDAVGACVGVRGSRIKNIVDELGGEKIDIVRWNESSQILIQNALKPAEVSEIALCLELGKATVVVAEDQLSLAIGKRGQNVRLAARLTGWDVDILTPAEHTKNLELLAQTIRSVEGCDDLVVDKVIAMGFASVYDLDELDDPTPLVEMLEIEAGLAERIIEQAGEAVITLEEEKEAAAKAKAEAEAAGIKPEPAAPSAFVSTDAKAAPTDASDPFITGESPAPTSSAEPTAETDSTATEAAAGDAPASATTEPDNADPFLEAPVADAQPPAPAPETPATDAQPPVNEPSETADVGDASGEPPRDNA